MKSQTKLTKSLHLQNEALYDICTNLMKVKVPTHEDLNNVIAKVMAGFTSKPDHWTRIKPASLLIDEMICQQRPCDSPECSTLTYENWPSTWYLSRDCTFSLSATLLS